MNGIGRLMGKHDEPSCGPATEALDKRMVRNPTLAERVQVSIKTYEAEIEKLREIEKLLAENPQIEQLINALGNANLRY